MADKLSGYRRKRRFEETPEPDGSSASAPLPGGRFVIQEHHATRLHWDLRLEHDGVLASWAVPNGIPEEPEHNRKAVHTEDHPLEYLDFHGEIPAGNYGAGTMTIWDAGTYECHKWRDDEVMVTFAGDRVQGRYVLFRTGADDKDWMIHRMDPPADPHREPLPERLAPMLARAGDLPADESGWAFEVKWDGIRALAYSQPGRLRLESRNFNDITARYPEVRALNRALSSHEALLDGEIVAFDAEGRPSFERLQQRMNLTGESAIRRRARDTPVVYVVFDLLHLDGHPLLDLPYAERREQLLGLGLDGPSWQTPSHHVGNGAALLEAVRAKGLEGIVAKRLDSRYEPGRRAGSWLKLKAVRRQEVVIAGWLPGAGRRRDRIGALLTGWFDQGELRFAGKVGTGFSEAELDRLADRLGPLERPTSPFSGRQPQRGAIYAEPVLVAEVEFTEWTAEGMLRHPSYKGLRDDKPATEVVREPAPGLGPARDEEPRDVTAPAAGRSGATADPRTGATAARSARSATRSTPPTGAARTSRGGAAAAPALEAALAAREQRPDTEALVEGRVLKLSNLTKVMYPATGFTKGDVIDYYRRIAPVLLPHLAGRPLTLKRYPNGVEGKFFYEKQCPKHRPEWVTTVAVPSERKRDTIDFCVVGDLPSLVWTSNLADLELHTSLSLAKTIERPTMMVFDLDPGEPAGLLECCRVATWLRAMFDGLGLECFPKTSGSKGLQIYVPLNAETSYAHTKPFARMVAETLERGAPELVVSRMTKSLRPGKVLIDWSQNDEHKTTVNVYSLRARERPTVSTPVAWDEVEAVVDSGDAASLVFEADEVLERVERDGDLFAPVLSLRQVLPAGA